MAINSAVLLLMVKTAFPEISRKLDSSRSRSRVKPAFAQIESGRVFFCLLGVTSKFDDCFRLMLDFEHSTILVLPRTSSVFIPAYLQDFYATTRK